MPTEHVIPGFKGKIHDPIALARDMFDGKSASQKKDVLDASRILATVREQSSRIKDLEGKIADLDKIVNSLLTK